MECGAWGTLQLRTVAGKGDKAQSSVAPADMINLGQIKSSENERIKTNISEIDRVLGGGIVPGSLVLLSGEPGVGKSTMVAQIIQSLHTEKDIIYVSGEESAEQIKDRLDRLEVDGRKIKFISETDVDKILAAVEKNIPTLLIVDSIQTVYTSASPGESGSISQIRSSAVRFLENAKNKKIATILIGHITKDGQIAGPKSLEHIVDTVVYLENDNAYDYRILRTSKNRFGSVNELGIFEMTSSGFREIKNPSLIFIENNSQKITGSVISSVMEGTRPFLVEIQALVTKTVFGYPVRKASGFDLNRLQVLAAVISKRTKANLANQDVILNIVGGLKINDPALDLAVCMSIVSSLLNQVVDKKTIVLGEIGLGGEVRNVSKLEQRLKEAEKLGFNKAIIPDSAVKIGKLEIVKMKNLNEVMDFMM